MGRMDTMFNNMRRRSNIPHKVSEDISIREDISISDYSSFMKDANSDINACEIWQS